MTRARLALLAHALIALAILLPAATASANGTSGTTVSPAANGEPAYTKPVNGSNTWYFTYSQISTNYHVCMDLYVDNAHSGSQSCTVNLSGSGLVKYTHAVTEGHFYDVTAEACYDSGGINSCHTPASSGTTIDASAPSSVYTGIGGATQQYTNDPNMALTIYYTDSISPPWYQGSTFDCWSKGVANGDCANNPGHNRQFAFDPGCSYQISFGAQLNTSWQCTYDISSFGGDGKWFYCVREADSAVPDVNNDNAPNQFAPTSDKANLSPDTPANCGYITLDRGAPTVTAHADKLTVTKGGLVNFSATASDSLSGVDNNYTWSFGDNTSNDTGQNVSHTYTEVGTYQAKVTTHDGAGNAGSGTVTITVKAPSGGGTGGNTGGNNGGNTTSFAGLTVSAPKKIKAGKKTVSLALTSQSGGRVSAALIKGGSIKASATKSLPSAGTFPLKLKAKKKLKKGKYTIQVSWTPAGQSKAVTKTLTLKVVKKK